MFETFWNTFIYSPYFGIALSIFTFYIGVKIRSRFNNPFANPLIIAMVLCIVFLEVFNVPYEAYNLGGDIIYMFLAPMTALLAVSVYNRLEVLKKNLIPILVGTFVGSAAAIGSIIVMSRIFGLDEAIKVALYPKSVTTAIALPLAEMAGGVTAVTFASTTITGFTGAIAAPFLGKIFGIKNKTALGLAIGTSTHALGTTRAFQMGETEGAMSSIAICLAGVSTVIIYSFLGLG